MIKNPINVGRYCATAPCTEGGGRKLTDGPLYDVSDVLKLTTPQAMLLWSRGAIKDAQKWGLDLDDLARMLRNAITRGVYLGSEWCLAGGENQSVAACDSYKVEDQYWNEAARRELECTFYIKFAIGKTGMVLLMASNHPEGA